MNLRQPQNARHRPDRRGSLALLALPAISSLLGCNTEKEQVVTARLEVSDVGAYALDGMAVPKDELKHALRAKRPENGKLLLHVVASPQASFEAVGHAMQAAQYAGAQVGIVGNVRF